MQIKGDTILKFREISSRLPKFQYISRLNLFVTHLLFFSLPVSLCSSGFKILSHYFVMLFQGVSSLCFMLFKLLRLSLSCPFVTTRQTQDESVAEERRKTIIIEPRLTFSGGFHARRGVDRVSEQTVARHLQSDDAGHHWSCK